jgi:hypothetical protein
VPAEALVHALLYELPLQIILELPACIFHGCPALWSFGQAQRRAELVHLGTFFLGPRSHQVIHTSLKDPY